MIKPRKTLESILPYETDFYKQEWRLKLDANENIYGCPNSVVSAIKNIPTQDISLYPTYGNVIEKFASKYNLNNDNILFTNGCDEALNIIVNTYLDKDDEILSYGPTFSMPALYAQIVGAKTRFVEYSNKFIFNKQELEYNIQPQTKIVYIATPNNPTGEVVKASVIELLAQKNANVLFVVDCTYVNFSYSVAYEDYLDLTNKYENIVVVKSYSKDFAIAGLRLGVAVANSNIIQNLKKVISPYSVNIIAMYCALVILNDDKRMEEIKESNDTARTLLYNELARIGYISYPSEANFVLCDFGSHSDFYYEKLKKNGVIVRKYSKNSSLKNCIRITVPKIGGVKYIIELLNKKDLLIFNVDNTIVNIENSSIAAIEKIVEYFSKKRITKEEIIEIKTYSGMNSNWNCVRFILERRGVNVSEFEIASAFQDIYYNLKDKNPDFLINKEELLISEETIKELSYKYDFVVFSNRFKEEVKYVFEKYDIDKYFYYYVTSDNLPKNMLKPHPKGCQMILENCPYKTIKYLGSSVDDIIAAKTAGIEAIGVISPICDYNAMVNNFRHLGIVNILGDIKNIKSFIEEFEENNV